MKLFIDTANIEEIRDANSLGVISGVTTNPSLVAKENGDFKTIIKEITEIVDGPISAEVLSLDYEGMISEARELIKISKNIVIKLPTTLEGLKACSTLSKEGVKTNLTLVFSANQALLAARAGATYVSPFVGRLDDIGEDGLILLSEIKTIFDAHGMDTKIIAASIRNPLHIKEAAKMGIDIATIPYKVILSMIKHHLTDAGIKKFMDDWNKK